MLNRIIGEFLRTDDEKVCLEVESSNGNLKYHLRVYRNECGWAQDWRPTDEGIVFSPGHLLQSIKLLEKAKEENPSLFLDPRTCQDFPRER